MRAPNNYGFLLANLVLRDFKIRYRNMSLGVFWSLLNPLVMMAVLTFIFTKVFRSTDHPNFHVFVLCGIIPYNFFALGWVSGTTSVVSNSSLVKRVLFPREIVPVATVLANCIHFLIQIALLIAMALASGHSVDRNWLLLPVIFGLEVVFVCGLSLASSAFDVYFRDVRYVVESANTVLFWLVPIFYSFTVIPPRFHFIYQYNPVAAVVLGCRNIILEGKAPPDSLLSKLVLVSFLALGAGFWIFHRLKRKFADYL
jgi:ABC-type polysaccharide/polyol phosphate export permease